MLSSEERSRNTEEAVFISAEVARILETSESLVNLCPVVAKQFTGLDVCAYSDVDARKKGDVSRKALTAAPKASSQKPLRCILSSKNRCSV